MEDTSSFDFQRFGHTEGHSLTPEKLRQIESALYRLTELLITSDYYSPTQKLDGVELIAGLRGVFSHIGGEGE